MKLVITGASGQLGRRTSELAADIHEPGNLILVTRQPDALVDLAARGAEVRFGDFGDARSLDTAFRGGERMLLISATDLETRTEQHRTAIAAAAGAGIRHVIYTSGLAPEPPNPAAVAPSHWATEQALAQSGLAWTVLRNSLYAEYQAPVAARAIETRRLVHNQGDGEVAYVSREDCARAAAAVLTADGHEGRVYDITGPGTYTAAQFAMLCAELAGHDVEDVALDDEAFIAGLVGEATDDDHMRYGAALVASFGRSIREGYMASCTDSVAALTGRAPRRLAQVLESALSTG